ncbi:MAG: hypothetical protein MPK06_04875 [Alphaproteobacteria bacterium]|nr:hypothetical protein [Alphaproteobacteria bacterium]MDA8003424.1 hypothetical protein [Alphaproteobacteria bacterium]MDA8005854.1 hypothetical protein [Alphaproteobacteria bacterium]MDA8012391.1 hypothetical protein [Alphaproteobacteria bacterium]
MAFVIAFSAVVLIIGLALLSRGIARRHAAGVRMSPWVVPVLGVVAGLVLLLAGQKLWSLLSLPFLARLFHLVVRLSPRNLFWVVAYQIFHLLRYRLSPGGRARSAARRADATVMSLREARRVLGLGATATADEVRSRAEELLRASAHPERREWRHGDDNAKNLVLLKVLEAREVVLRDIADRERQNL